jgi:uncharacterized protein YggE
MSMKKSMLIGSAFLLAASPVAAQATKRVAGDTAASCTSSMQTQVSLNVNFNLQAETPLDAKKKFEAKLAVIDGAVKKAGLKKFNLQSMNYSVSPMGGYGGEETGYQMNGNTSYQLDDADKAFALMEQFGKQRMMASVNVNQYNTGNCPSE